MSSSKIEWTESTWNPVTGCTKVSAGCRLCYAESMAIRHKGNSRQPNYRNGFKLTLQPHMLDRPLAWKRSRRVFVCSMADLFHKDVPLEYIKRVFEIMNRAKQHTFQVLTKRADRLAEISDELPWSPNIWMGVTVESDDYAWRVQRLLESGAHTKFLSLEPLLGPVPSVPVEGLEWVVVGGESGSSPKPMDVDWVRPIRDRCVVAEVPFFFKQWGGRNKKKAGRLLEGRTWDEYPEDLDWDFWRKDLPKYLRQQLAC